MRPNVTTGEPRLIGLTAMMIFTVASIAHSQSTETNWPQFRGPSGQGTSHTQDLPLSWSATENIAWKTALPAQGHRARLYSAIRSI